MIFYDQGKDHRGHIYRGYGPSYCTTYNTLCLNSCVIYPSLWLCNHNTMYNYTYSILSYSMYYATPLYAAKSDSHHSDCTLFCAIAYVYYAIYSSLYCQVSLTLVYVLCLFLPAHYRNFALAIIQSDQWEEGLRHPTDGETFGRMIQKMPCKQNASVST